MTVCVGDAGTEGGGSPFDGLGSVGKNSFDPFGRIVVDVLVAAGKRKQNLVWLLILVQKTIRIFFFMVE